MSVSALDYSSVRAGTTDLTFYVSWPYCVPQTHLHCVLHGGDLTNTSEATNQWRDFCAYASLSSSLASSHFRNVQAGTFRGQSISVVELIPKVIGGVSELKFFFPLFTLS